MDEENIPLSVVELMKLTDLGIPVDHVTWSRVTMSSDAHICVRYDNNQAKQRNSKGKDDMKKQLLVLHLKRDGITHKSWPISPESAAMSPDTESGDARLAFKTGSAIMVVKLEPWSRFIKCHLADVQYWTWVSSSIIALVTDRCVYHWDIKTGGIPEKVFQRDRRLNFTEIVNYKVDPDHRWYALTGLEPQEEYVSGIVQLYSVDNYLTQCISAHAVTFVKYRFEGNTHPSSVLCVATRDCDTFGNGKVHVVELGPHQKGNLALGNHNDHITFVDSDNNQTFDFPAALQVSAAYGLMYVFSKYGHMYICDIESAVCLISTQISTSIIFSTTLNTSTQGVLAVSRSGQVLSINIKTEHLVKYVREVAKKFNQADRLEKGLAQYCVLSGQSLI